MLREFFSHTDIPQTQINLSDGSALDLVEGCNSYEEKIKKAGVIELFLGGTGDDGHIAFNEPGKPCFISAPE